MTKVNRDGEERQPKRYGKFTFMDNAFLASCEAGQSVIYHHPKYVVLSRKAYENLHSELEKVRQEAEKRGYQKGYWNRKADDKEEKEILESDEAHRTEDGWCCACGYDMAILDEKIKKVRQETIKECLEALPKCPDTLTDDSHDQAYGGGFKDAIDQATQNINNLDKA